MNRIITNLNFIGVVALAILCMFQWESNSQIYGQLGRANQVRLDQAAKIAEQDATLNQNSTDLADLRQRLSLAESELKTARDDQAAADQQRDQLKTALDKWAAACAARDQEIKQAAQQIQTLTAERDQAILKFNDLADKYNGVVKQLNDVRGK
jgi:chromosome segregation ATPase